jgi:hypothetical protein
MERRRQSVHIDERLDEALAESFPASDSPAVNFDDPPLHAPRARVPKLARVRARRSRSPAKTPRKAASRTRRKAAGAGRNKRPPRARRKAPTRPRRKR